jgi:hypothetical protein
MLETDVEQILGRPPRTEARAGGLARKTWNIEAAEQPGKRVDIRLDFKDGQLKRKAAREPTTAPALAPPHVSPAAAFQAFDAALSARAWDKAGACLTAEALDLLLTQLITEAALARRWAQTMKRPAILVDLPDILKAHGLDEQDFVVATKSLEAQRDVLGAVAMVKDKAVLLAEVLDLVETEAKHGGDGKITLADVVEQDGSATGKVTIAASAKTLPVRFKTGTTEGWRLDFEERSKPLHLLSAKLGIRLVTMEWMAK